MENFKSLNKKKCRVIMAKQIYQSSADVAHELARSINNSSNSGSRKSYDSANFKRLSQTRINFDKSRSPDNKEKQYIMTGNVIQQSPLKPRVDSRINYDIYKQDSLAHRPHLLELMKKTKL